MMVQEMVLYLRVQWGSNTMRGLRRINNTGIDKCIEYRARKMQGEWCGRGGQWAVVATCDGELVRHSFQGWDINFCVRFALWPSPALSKFRSRHSRDNFTSGVFNNVYPLSVKLDAFQIKLYTILNKSNAFEIRRNVFQINTSISLIKLNFSERLIFHNFSFS